VKADGGELHLIEDSLEIARLAAERGWIRTEAVDAVAAEFELDRQPPTPLEELIEHPPRSTSETSRQPTPPNS